MTPKLPDKLDSNARVEVRLDGTTVGTRRIVDFVDTGATGTDDGTNDKVTLSFPAGGSGSFGPNLILDTLTTHAAATATATNWDATWHDARDGTDTSATPILSGPTGIGLSYVLDDATPAITATENGSWLVSTDFILDTIPAAAAGDYIEIELITSNGLIIPKNMSTYPSAPWPPSGSKYLPVSASGVIYLDAADTLTVTTRYYTSDPTAPLIYGTLSLARLA